MSKSSREQVEQDELKLLAELVKNSNENIETIAKRSGFSRQKASRMIKQLEAKGLIWGHTAIFDEEKLGLTHFMLILKRTSKPLKEGTADRIISRRVEDIMKKLDGTIESSAYVHGDYDWVVTFTAKDIKQAKKYSDTLIALHPGEIEKVTLLQTMMFVKKHYVLNPDRKKLKEFL
jgi:DNA-binding Lrp family transcriptional regulator